MIKLTDGRTLDRLPDDAETAAMVRETGGNAYLRGYTHPLAALTSIGGVKIEDAPFVENIHKRVYDAAKADDSFSMLGWGRESPCGTGRCRGGHVVNLAGSDGFAFWRSANKSWDTAALAIYIKSDPQISEKGYPNFSGEVPNADALADMKRCAELEAA